MDIVKLQSAWSKIPKIIKSLTRKSGETNKVIEDAITSGKLRFGKTDAYKGYIQSSNPMEMLPTNGTSLSLVKPIESVENPWTSTWNIVASKPLVQIENIPGLNRSTIMQYAKNNGADAIIFKDSNEIFVTPNARTKEVQNSQTFNGKLSTYKTPTSKVIQDTTPDETTTIPATYFRSIINKMQNFEGSPRKLTDDELLYQYSKLFGKTGSYSELLDDSSWKWVNAKELSVENPDEMIQVPTYKFELHPLNWKDARQLKLLGEEINRRRLFKSDFTKFEDLNGISDITVALKQHPFIKDYRLRIDLPLDIHSLNWFNKYTGKGLGSYLMKDLKKIRGTSIKEQNRSIDGLGTSLQFAVKDYGYGPFKTSITPIKLNYYDDISPNEMEELLYGNNAQNRDMEWKNGKIYVTNGSNSTEIPLTFTSLHKIASGIETPDFERFKKVIDEYFGTLTRHSESQIQKLREIDPSATLKFPEIPIYRNDNGTINYRKYAKILENLYSDPQSLSGSEWRAFKPYVKRQPFVIEGNKNGGIIKYAKSNKND